MPATSGRSGTGREVGVAGDVVLEGVSAKGTDRVEKGLIRGVDLLGGDGGGGQRLEGRTITGILQDEGLGGKREEIWMEVIWRERY